MASSNSQFEGNVVVARRLAIVEKLSKAQVKAYVDGKLSVEEIAEQLNESHVRALYGVRQRAVAEGFIPVITIDADDMKQVREAHGNGENADWAYLACRAGVTPQRLQTAAKGEVSFPPAPRTPQGKQAPKGNTKSTKSRRTQKSAA